MPLVLVVDDETGFREMLGEHLASCGHRVETASNARSAIDIGVRCLPDVLVTDWMLKDHIHGLQVSDALQAANPSMQTVLITGFPSEDLKKNAKHKGIFDFIEKPFEPDDLERAVQKAANARENAQTRSTIAILDVDANGALLFTNPTAKEFLDEASIGQDAACLADIFSPDAVPDLNAAVDRWIKVTPSSDDTIVWALRSQEPRENKRRMVVMVRQGEQTHMSTTIIEILLGYASLDTARWPIEGRILAIDDSTMLRSVFLQQLEDAGAGCYAVSTPQDALRILKGDDGIKYVLHEFEIDGFDTVESIRNIQAARPDVLIVGTSGSFHRDEFASLGIDHYLQKPWTIKKLSDALLGRFGDCGECGQPLPLRQPKPSEQASSWKCTFCGSLYRAVRDDTFPEDLMGNVSRREE